MNTSTRIRSVCFSIALLINSTSSPASTLFLDNFPENTELHFNSLNTTHQIHASDFTTGAEMTLITEFWAILFNTDQVHTVDAYIFTDNGSGSPGSLYATFDTPMTVNVTPVNLVHSFLATDSGILLQANTTYWYALRSATEPRLGGFGSVFWNASEPPDPISGEEFSFVSSTRNKVSLNDGVTWQTTITGSYAVQLMGNVVPEPSKVAFLTLSATWLLSLRRRKVTSAHP